MLEFWGTIAFLWYLLTFLFMKYRKCSVEYFSLPPQSMPYYLDLENQFLTVTLNGAHKCSIKCNCFIFLCCWLLFNCSTLFLECRSDADVNSVFKPTWWNSPWHSVLASTHWPVLQWNLCSVHEVFRLGWVIYVSRRGCMTFWNSRRLLCLHTCDWQHSFPRFLYCFTYRWELAPAQTEKIVTLMHGYITAVRLQFVHSSFLRGFGRCYIQFRPKSRKVPCILLNFLSSSVLF